MEKTGEDNEGLKKRRQFFGAKSPEIDLLGHLHCDIFNQNKFLLSGVEMRLRLVRSSDDFCLMDVNGTAQIDITSASLIARRVRISSGVLLAHANALLKMTAKYPLTRVEVKPIHIARGVSGEALDNVIIG